MTKRERRAIGAGLITLVAVASFTVWAALMAGEVTARAMISEAPPTSRNTVWLRSVDFEGHVWIVNDSNDGTVYFTIHHPDCGGNH